MSNKHIHIYSRIYSTLLRCDEFNTDNDLRSAFVDARILQWQSAIPNANNRESRVRAVIDMLRSRYDMYQVNALVLLLRVFGENKPANDMLRQELLDLASEFENLLEDSELALAPGNDNIVRTYRHKKLTSIFSWFLLELNEEGIQLHIHWVLVLVVIISVVARIFL